MDSKDADAAIWITVRPGMGDGGIIDWQKLWIPFMRFKVGQRLLWQEISMIITTLPHWNISISTTLLIYLPEHRVAMGQRLLTVGMENGEVLTRYC